MVEKKITDDLYNLYHETRLMLVREITVGNGIDLEEAIKYAQIIMDRIVFTCFVEDRGLLPANIFEKTILEPIEKHTPKLRIDDDNKQVDRNLIWTNLNYLFQDINEGASLRDITKYNGKIFRDDLNFIKIRDLTIAEDEFSDLKLKHGPLLHKLIIVGEMTISGALIPIQKLAEIILIGKENGAKTILLPDISEPLMTQVPSDILEDIEIKFYHDPIEAWDLSKLEAESNLVS